MLRLFVGPDRKLASTRLGELESSSAWRTENIAGDGRAGVYHILVRLFQRFGVNHNKRSACGGGRNLVRPVEASGNPAILESGESLCSSPQSKALARNSCGYLPYVVNLEVVVVLTFSLAFQTSFWNLSRFLSVPILFLPVATCTPYHAPILDQRRNDNSMTLLLHKRAGSILSMLVLLSLSASTAFAQFSDFPGSGVTAKEDRDQMMSQLGISFFKLPLDLEDPNRPKNAWLRDASNTEGNWTDTNWARSGLRRTAVRLHGAFPSITRRCTAWEWAPLQMGTGAPSALPPGRTRPKEG